jgi:thiamine kinase-like enzyme
VDLQAIVDRVWPGRESAVEPLGGGITNHNFKVTVGGDAFVLRIGGKDTDLLGIDRSVEETAARTAAGVGIGPEVVDMVRPEGYLVTRFIDGAPIPVERMREPESIAAVAAAIRAFHQAPAIPGRFDSHRVVETYATTAARHGVSVPDAYGWAHGISERIERARGPQPLVPCHNDYLNANFLLAPDGTIRIVDWEYAGMGDRFFDLANFSVNHEFDLDADTALLAAYGGGRASHEDDVASIRLMRFMSDFREAMWGVVQQGISELDVDFVDYADQHFDRLRRTAADPAFERWLDRAGSAATDAPASERVHG